jgi:hypothetical protein
MPEDAKRRISEALKGRAKTAKHKAALRRAQIRYWALLPEGARSGVNWRPVRGARK